MTSARRAQVTFLVVTGALAFFAATRASWDGQPHSPPPDADELVQQMGSDDLSQREAASAALRDLGRPALPALRRGARSDNAEIRSRSLSLIDEIDGAVIALREFGATIEVDKDRPGEPVVHVGMDCTRVTPGTLVYLERFDSLIKLELWGPSVTDAGVAHIDGLKHLRELSLARSAVTDDGLAALDELAELEFLDLCNTPIKGDGLKHLRGMDKLCVLYLDRTAVTDKGLKHLEGLTGLAVLRLAHTQVSDAGLVHLKGLRGLRLLDLSHTQITDDGLSSLAELHELQRLDLLGTAVTPKGMAALAKSLPKLQQP